MVLEHCGPVSCPLLFSQSGGVEATLFALCRVAEVAFILGLLYCATGALGILSAARRSLWPVSVVRMHARLTCGMITCMSHQKHQGDSPGAFALQFAGAALAIMAFETGVAIVGLCQWWGPPLP
jgi:hypothetical protein